MKTLKGLFSGKEKPTTKPTKTLAGLFASGDLSPKRPQKTLAGFFSQSQPEPDEFTDEQLQEIAAKRRTVRAAKAKAEALDRLSASKPERQLSEAEIDRIVQAKMKRQGKAPTAKKPKAKPKPRRVSYFSPKDLSLIHI